MLLCYGFLCHGILLPWAPPARRSSMLQPPAINNGSPVGPSMYGRAPAGQTNSPLRHCVGPRRLSPQSLCHKAMLARPAVLPMEMRREVPRTFAV
ncbi:unnamed protein product [Victoria cruziana]